MQASNPIVPIQLETDERLLIPKARASLERYGHQVVIGNELNRRKYEVVFVSRASSPRENTVASDPKANRVDNNDSSLSGFVESWLRINIPTSYPASAPPKEIEEDIVAELVKRHELWMSIGQ
jgi:phosphopantothenate---cysteine ligase (ATP)